MADLTITNVPDEIHRALIAQASEYGRSADAEGREIIANAVRHKVLSPDAAKPKEKIRIGDKWHKIASLTQRS